MPIDYSQFAIPKGRSRFAEKQAKRAEEAKQMRACYKAVDDRDGYACRVCKAHASAQALGMLERAHHHHIAYRSKGGEHTTDNVCLLCAPCHAAVHDARLRIEGNADDRDPITGRLCGIKVERATESGWQVEKWI